MTGPIKLDYNGKSSSNSAITSLSTAVENRGDYIQELLDKLDNEEYTYSGHVTPEEKTALNELKELIREKGAIIKKEYTDTSKGLLAVRNSVNKIFDDHKQNENNAAKIMGEVQW